MAGLLTIVIPVFNEADSLEPLHAEIVAALGDVGPFEVVYVDDGSTDRLAGRDGADRGGARQRAGGETAAQLRQGDGAHRRVSPRLAATSS